MSSLTRCVEDTMAYLTSVGSARGHTTDKTPTSENETASQFAAALKDALQRGTGSPENAPNGAAAARDLTNPNNSYF
jgi:hypothetical protein